MSLLLKRRSRSETRTKPPAAQESPALRMERPRRGRARETRNTQKTEHMQLEEKDHGSPPYLDQLDLGGSGSERIDYFPELGVLGQSLNVGRRKTSAELISEAKLFLDEADGLSTASSVQHMASIGGARLVSTRRPITPREPGRVLYGKVALAGRPPSAFSMRYLQNESNKPLTPPAMPATRVREPSQSNVNAKELFLNRRAAAAFDFSSVVESCKLPPRQLPALHGDTQPPPTRNGALLTQSSTETLIELLKQHAGLKECSEETVQHINAILQELYTRVRKQERNYKRGVILGSLYGLVECNAPRVLLAVARVVLALRVTGSNLTGACKLIFKVARNEQHDSLFYENDLLELLIDGLGHASPLDEPEACIYAYGSIRFLTAGSTQERDDALNRNWTTACLDDKAQVLAQPQTQGQEPASEPNAVPLLTMACMENVVQQAAARFRKFSRQCTLVDRLARHGALELMILHLQILNEAGATRRLSGPPLHTLYQLSAALRALADVHQQRGEEQDITISTNVAGADSQLRLELACPHLIRAAEISMGELEVQANIVRTLSVLSEDVGCCETLLNYAARIGMLLGPCADAATQAPNNSQQYTERLMAIISRLGYILGNILAKYDSSRVQYYHNDVAMEYLLNILDVLTQAPAKLHSSQGDTLADVQIKLIRVVANMSVNAEVGFGLGNTRILGSVLLQLLSTTSAALTAPGKMQEKRLTELQELLHATLGALHNLCFYQHKQTALRAQIPDAEGSLQGIIAELATALCTALRHCQSKATKVELTRVLGNLTRNEQARRCFCVAGGLPLIVQQLTRNAAGQDYELKTCAIGVLVNLMGDSENRAPFLQLHGAEVLALLLRGALEQEDWFLATIVSQALWNLFIDAQYVVELCQTSTLDEVSDLLADYLDEERVLLVAGEQDTLDMNVGDADTPPPDVLWEDFAVVATDLLERIQNNFDKQIDSNTMVSPHSSGTPNENEDDKDVFIEEI